MAMIFGGRSISEIDDAELANLVDEAVEEDQDLEFKSVFHRSSEESRFNLLKEIAAFANAGGGYLIVGIEDDEDRAGGFVGTEPSEAEEDALSLRDLCLDHLKPRVEDLEVQSRQVRGNGLTVVRVPPSARTPHMISYQRRTFFLRRVDDSKREMSHAEIRSAFLDEPVAKGISDLGSKVARLLEASERDSQYEWLRDHIRAGGTGLSESENGRVVARLARERFEEGAGETPSFWIAVTPRDSLAGTLPVEEERLRDLLEDPPGSRPNGWSMEIRHESLTRTPDGLGRGDREDEYLEVTENGHMEFWTPLDEHFCWRQSQQEFQRRPRLYPYSVVEYPVSFLRLYRALADEFGVEGKVLLQYQYRNLTGYILRPFHPQAIRHRAIVGGPYEGNHFQFGPRDLPHDFGPEKTALEALEPFYAAFGLEPFTIPFYDEEEEGFVFQ